MTPNQMVTLVGFSLVAVVGIWMAVTQRARNRKRQKGTGRAQAGTAHGTKRRRARRR